MIVLIWPLVLVFTVVLYGLILITLPFNVTYATIFLFSLIAFWSRLPGVGIRDPSYIIYLADFVDLFSLIVAINIGGFAGGLIALFGNIAPRLCGFYPYWYMVLEDGIGQFLVCLIIPWFHVAMGGDILISMIIYTILRIVIILPVDFFICPYSKVQWVIEIIVGGIGLFVINAFYAKMFGGFLDGLLQKGVQFSWTLFLFASAVILIFYILVFKQSKESKSPKARNLFQDFIKIIRKKSKRKKKSRHQTDDINEMSEIRKLKESINRK